MPDLRGLSSRSRCRLPQWLTSFDLADLMVPEASALGGMLCKSVAGPRLEQSTVHYLRRTDISLY